MNCKCELGAPYYDDIQNCKCTEEEKAQLVKERWEELRAQRLSNLETEILELKQIIRELKVRCIKTLFIGFCIGLVVMKWWVIGSY